MLTNVVSYLLIICFLFMQRILRRGEQAKSLSPGETDRGTTRLIGMAFGLSFLALIIAPWLNAFEVARLDIGFPVGWAGIASMLVGLALRWWANATLGRFYTSTLRLSEEQQIVKKGPYRLVRHPGYAGVGASTYSVVFTVVHGLLISDGDVAATALGRGQARANDWWTNHRFVASNGPRRRCCRGRLTTSTPRVPCRGLTLTPELSA